jgi:hypothetical protein
MTEGGFSFNFGLGSEATTDQAGSERSSRPSENKKPLRPIEVFAQPAVRTVALHECCTPCAEGPS